MSDRKVPLNLYKISQPFSSKVLQNIKLTSDSSPNDTRHVVLDLKGSTYQYLEGQSVGVLPEGHDKEGHAYSVRLYSIASHRRGDKDFPNSLSLCVKRVVYEDPKTGKEVRGVGSNFVCDLKEGDSVRITGPVGNRFLLPESLNEHHYIFIATGTGIAPYRGMLEELFEQKVQSQVWLFFGVPYRSDLLYEKEFRSYEHYPNFHFVPAISREEKNADGSKVYVQHRLLQHQKDLAPFISDPKTLIYVCGLKGSQQGVEEALKTILPPSEHDTIKKRIIIEVY